MQLNNPAIIAAEIAAAEVVACPGQSISVKIAPRDKKCRYWAKVVRAEAYLAAPEHIDGASDISCTYRRAGDEELFEGDALIEGEEMHHRKARGWTYWVTFMGRDGSPKTVKPSSEIKSAMKAAGLAKNLLAGSGDVAACARIVHGLRAGLIDVIEPFAI